MENSERARAVEEGIEILLERRHNDPQRRFRDRLLGPQPEAHPPDGPTPRYVAEGGS